MTTMFSKAAETVKDKAELKFKAQDYSSALRFANMAKDLDPNLHGIQHYITAYTVHAAVAATSASTGNQKRKYFNNSELDWYAILGLTDDSIDTEEIKKQYKKMAIMVHPDKNNSAAAEGAFKLISDAWNLLSNQSMRMAYDQRSGRGISKRRTTSSSTTFHHHHHHPEAAKNKAAPPPPPPARNTTTDDFGDGKSRACPKCGIMCGYETKKSVSSSINCGNCQRRFIFVRCSSNRSGGATHQQRSSPPAAACWKLMFSLEVPNYQY